MRKHLRYLVWLGVALMLLLGVSVAQASTIVRARTWTDAAVVGSAITRARTWTADPPAKGNLSPQDQAFARKAAQIDLGEEALGKLAQQKATGADVKDFGKLMVTDHTKAERSLKAAASAAGITLPSQPSAQQQQMEQKLSSQSGTQFDQAYVRGMLKGHDKAIQAFQTEIENGQNPQLKQYAERELPVIQDHIRIAENLAGREKMSGKAGLNNQSEAIVASNQR